MIDLPLTALTDTVAFVDPAGSHKRGDQIKATRARSAVVVLGQDDLSRIYVLHAWADRCPTDRLTDHIFLVWERWHPRVIGVEANAMQVLYADSLSREARMRGKKLPLTPVMQPTKVDKDWRIRSVLQPVLMAGRLLAQPDQHEFRQELATFPMSPTKDLVDACASAISLLRRVHLKRERDSEVDAHLAYLRASGAPPAYIESVTKGREILDTLARP